MKAGFIAVVGRPNVGKSTLTNKLVSEKVAIVSDKAGTTRDSIKGILNHGGNQYIFIDTPGIHKPKHLLGEHMTSVAIQTLKEVEVILFVLDGSQEISTGDQFVMERIEEARNTPRVLVINKIDKMSDEAMEAKRAEIEEKLGKFDGVVELSAEYALGLPKLLTALDPYLEEGMMYYPEDMYTDMPMYKIITETVREKLLHKTRDEIPHSIAVEIVDVVRRPNGKDRYDINIYVERSSQKGIVIGQNGKVLKEVGIEARRDIEEILGKKIYMNLWVKVKEKWRKKKPFLKEMGYHLDED
ncbi:GTPase Era [Propionigenium maris DSM 9537]|uniref:GTPase Era n=1 Tax=Propionigenium maris DSM 9537 TaxID=1123000 RepID=A0A9W6GIR9_9FUSO|nr:GTPase Era [Propionigenium maris]GLI55944.1 GTPase Era [Propionigenium maris DSM 9537]